MLAFSCGELGLAVVDEWFVHFSHRGRFGLSGADCVHLRALGRNSFSLSVLRNRGRRWMGR